MSGPIPRPTYNSDPELIRVAGRVTSIWVEQEGKRDQVHFTLLREGFVDATGREYLFMLDEGTTVALAQLQLLRDAMAHDWLVTIDYSKDDDYYGYTVYWVYYVKVSLDSATSVTGMNSFDLNAILGG